MVVVSDNKGVAARHKANSCGIPLFLQSILTLLLVKVPYLHVFTATGANNSSIEEVHIVDALCMPL